MINYIIQVILFQTIFLAVYDFVLSKETFFSKNRVYLLGTFLLSFCIPFLQFSTEQISVVEEYRILLPEIVINPQEVIEQTNVYQSFDYWLILFWGVVTVMTLLFVLKLWKLVSLIQNNKIVKEKGLFVVLLEKQNKAFSFLGYVFINKDVKGSVRDHILEHERIHVQQLHSLDLLLFEVFKILMWFNPMVFVYQKRITVIHEFLADNLSEKTNGQDQYLQSLVYELFDVNNITFANQFYKKSILKKRLKMMKRKKSNSLKQLKYLSLVPMCLMMLFYVSCSTEKKNDKKQSTVEKNEVKKELQKEEVYFSNVDKVPTFPGCDSADKDCFNKEIQKHFVKHFDAELPKREKLSPGKKRIVMMFTIDKSGEISDVVTKAPDVELKDEAERVIKLLPQMTPGEQDGKTVAVKYTLPMRIDVK